MTVCFSFFCIATRSLSVPWDLPGVAALVWGGNLSTKGLCSKDMLCFWRIRYKRMVAFFCLLLVSTYLNMYCSTCILYVVVLFWDFAPSHSDQWNLINLGLNPGLVITKCGTVDKLLPFLRLLI